MNFVMNRNTQLLIRYISYRDQIESNTVTGWNSRQLKHDVRKAINLGYFHFKTKGQLLSDK